MRARTWRGDGGDEHERQDEGDGDADLLEGRGKGSGGAGSGAEGGGSRLRAQWLRTCRPFVRRPFSGTVPQA